MTNRASRAALPLVGLACVTLCLLSLLLGPCPYCQGSLPPPAAVLPERPSFGDIPLSFEANQGQAGSSTQFLARGRGYSLSLNRDGVVVALGRHRGPRATTEPEAVRPVERTLLRMTLAGANPAPSAAGLEELPGKVNYFIGRDPKTWRTNIPTYGRVRYGAVYRGIDLVYYGNGRQLEYDFIVAPGADPGVITLAFEGADALAVSAEGDLVLQTRGGELRLRKPLIYQEVGGTKRSVPGGYVVRGERGVGFQVARLRRDQAPHHRSGAGLFHLPRRHRSKTMAAGSPRMPPGSTWRV